MTLHLAILLRRLAPPILCLLALTRPLAAQTAAVEGTVHDAEGAPLPGANVLAPGPGLGTATEPDGRFRLDGLPAADSLSLRVSFTGYRDRTLHLRLAAGERRRLAIRLTPEAQSLSQVVVSAEREAVLADRTAFKVEVISRQNLEAAQAQTLADGLAFNPGLRLETNCQNCGFTQLRMNGLEGPYTQILINSRPLFTALMGVYGLDFIPADFIERIEVVRGGGSALYGGSAIAGAVNIITRQPAANELSVGYQQAWTGLAQPDGVLNYHASMASEAGDRGLALYGFRRRRAPWDANGDGYSEITALEAHTLGFEAFQKAGERHRFRLHGMLVDEFRRGGNDFDLRPHESDLAEQLEHGVVAAGLSYDGHDEDLRHRWSAYVSAQLAGRDSYYGGGGRVLGPGDSLTAADLQALNAYGDTEDQTLLAGGRWSRRWTPALDGTAGLDWQRTHVTDRMPGYERLIDQRTEAVGIYQQLSWTPSDRWKFQGGLRLERLAVSGDYRLAGEAFGQERRLMVLAPRAAALYRPGPWRFRLSYAEGYRGPQAFDEDLHIETVGGAARFLQLAPELAPERSRSYTASAAYSRERTLLAWRVSAGAFATRLQDAFVQGEARALSSGVSVVDKTNGGGGMVSGLHLEVQAQSGGRWRFRLGGTWQRAVYDEAFVLWEPTNDEAAPVSTRAMLRTPDWYGFATAEYRWGQAWEASLSGAFTGPMDAPHVVDPINERTIIERTPAFADLGLQLTRRLRTGSEKARPLHLYAGAYNLLDSYQDDFDTGPERDAGYIYGPSRPRTLYVGLQYHLDGW